MAHDEKPHLVAKVKLVGEVVFARSVVESDIGALNSAAVILSPALTRVLVPQCAYLSETSLRLAGGDSNTTRVLSETAKVFPAVADIGFELPSSIVPTAQRNGRGMRRRCASKNTQTPTRVGTPFIANCACSSFKIPKEIRARKTKPRRIATPKTAKKMRQG